MIKINKSTLTAFFLIIGFLVFGLSQINPIDQTNTNKESIQGTSKAQEALNSIEIKGRAPKTGYSREEFSNGWDAVDGCDTRNLILQRDLNNTLIDNDSCTVLSGVLIDPYSGETINFNKGDRSIDIDHVVALSDAWQKGAQSLNKAKREELYHDHLNLLASDASLNRQKGDSDTASWLPPNNEYRCRFVARQIAVKVKYLLWVTQAEHDAMERVLETCDDQELPV